MNRSLSIFFCPRHLLFKDFYPKTLCVPSPFLSSPSPADSIVGFLMSSLGSREKGRASQKAGGDGEGQREQGGNRRPTDRPRSRPPPLRRRCRRPYCSLHTLPQHVLHCRRYYAARSLLASSLKPDPSSKFSRVVTDPKKIGSPIRSSII